ncbi:hypothetical protein K488DRAFT_53720 [Vararia minispora EC-137]|uniref:Uncharacterized protein n=1 Tax=Vararia minispora EC-137 TaxID=1314806 RepID=A0ACB8QHA0_9AGAM|nr:hypothetical protein K488DRAFT_53720 [Vararia minispora EC-137]
MSTTATGTTVLGKRKTRGRPSYVLSLVSTSESEHLSASDYEPPADASEHEPSGEDATPSDPELEPKPAPKSKSSTPRPKRYACPYPNCPKAYSKPTRLAEHERSHTGLRPFVCSTCNKAYLRESHLQAHTRAHLPASERPFVCSEEGCGKRFWTAQHAHVHEKVHRGERPFRCEEEGCDVAFVKHGQLRVHIAEAHAPVGTKPYICTHEGCDKSFASNPKLKAHIKVHDQSRYTCSHAPCNTSATTFATWTVLQSHIRTAHPPTCTHCSRVFANSSRLRAHVKIHDQREAEDAMDECADGDLDDGEQPKKRRRGGEVGRDFMCAVVGCDKAFKSKKALETHHRVVHEQQRDFTCTTCGRAFGYKHIMLRHVARVHRAHSGSGDDAENQDMESAHDEGDDDEPDQDNRALPSLIDDITGRSYAAAASARKLACPYPDFDGLAVDVSSSVVSSPSSCAYVFHRKYDLRRHLRAVHGIDIEKDVLDRWTKGRI